MPNPSFRLSDELYARMKEATEAQNITLSDIVRESVAQWLDNGASNNGQPSHMVAHETVELLKAQLQAKDDQIAQLHQLVAMSQKHSDDFMKQLEDGRQHRAWWRFWERDSTQPA